VLRLVYQAKGRGQATSREVEPLGVVYYANAWYLIAWCRLRADYRHFRLDRIQQLALRETTFEPQLGFSLRAHLEESVRKEQTVPARIRFSREAAERARNECFAGLVEERFVGSRVEMDFLTFSLEWKAHWCCRSAARPKWWNRSDCASWSKRKQNRWLGFMVAASIGTARVCSRAADDKRRKSPDIGLSVTCAKLPGDYENDNKTNP
jgi:hypothetical protein